MKTYILYVHDDRYSVPTLDSLTVRDDARATQLAALRLRSSPHYSAVEVWDDDRLVGRLDRDSTEPRDD